jgi:hypothetical protein
VDSPYGHRCLELIDGRASAFPLTSVLQANGVRPAACSAELEHPHASGPDGTARLKAIPD